MKLTPSDAILAAVCYADIFDYPLTEDELSVWVPFLKRPRLTVYPELVEGQGGALRKFVQRLTTGGDTYYSIRSTKRLITIRSKRVAWSMDKWARALRVANLLKHIPTVKLVGVTGGLTRSNAKAEDDIDFLIITAPETLWLTRALATILLDILRLRRRPADTNIQNLVCLNMFMSEDGLAVSQKERDLFTAHEVLLMTPIWERDGTYKKFLSANQWVQTFLPNAWEEKVKSQKSKVKSQKSYKVFSILEPIAQFIQLRYMNRRRTTEVISDNVIRFHPRDARVWIKWKLGERLTRFNIPLDKIFYGS